jgi:hypothetical protein
VTSLYPDIFYYAFLFSKKEASIIFSTKKQANITSFTGKKNNTRKSPARPGCGGGRTPKSSGARYFPAEEPPPSRKNNPQDYMTSDPNNFYSALDNMELDTDSLTASPPPTSDIDSGGADATQGSIQSNARSTNSEENSDDTSKTPITGNARAAESISGNTSSGNGDNDMSSTNSTGTPTPKDDDESIHENNLDNADDISIGNKDHSPLGTQQESISSPPQISDTPTQLQPPPAPAVVNTYQERRTSANPHRSPSQPTPASVVANPYQQRTNTSNPHRPPSQRSEVSNCMPSTKSQLFRGNTSSSFKMDKPIVLKKGSIDMTSN